MTAQVVADPVIQYLDLLIARVAAQVESERDEGEAECVS
jgi:hypothetical protein